MRLLSLLIPVAFLILFTACEGDYRPKSMGAVDEIYVVMDSTDWNSDTAMAIRETFGRQIETVPKCANREIARPTN